MKKIIDFILKLLDHILNSESELDIEPEDMTFSENGITMLTGLEANKLKPYDDKTGETITAWCKGATIGIGHLILKSEWDKYKNGITKKLSIHLLKQDLKRFEDCIKEKVKIELQQSQFDALVIFSFNIGVGGFKNSSALKLINSPEAKTSYENLEAAWKAWNKQTIDGKREIVRGLINRRRKEWNLYEFGSYS